MNKKELVEKIADVSGLGVTVVDLAVNTLFSVVAEIVKVDKVDVKDFGVFKLKHKPARKARNPKTGATVDVQAKNTVTFKPAKKLVESVQ